MKIEKKKIEKYLIEIIQKVEKKKDVAKEINICFFSGKFFFQYLGYYKCLVELLEKNPFSYLYYLYVIYIDEDSDKTFYRFIIKRIERIAGNLNIGQNKNISVPNDFKEKMKKCFNQLSEARIVKFSVKEEGELTKKLYNLNQGIKFGKFNNTNYSREFFEKLKEVIIKSNDLQKRNLKWMINHFFLEVDTFFKKESLKASEKEKEADKKKFDLFQNEIIPGIDNLLARKSENLKKIISNKKKECLEIIDDEIKNASSRMKEAKGDLKKAAANLEKKMKEKINEMKKECEDEVKTIGEEIQKESEEVIDTYFNANDLSFSKVEIVKLKNVVISLTSGALGGVISGVGLYAGGAAIAAGVAAGSISLTTLTSFVGAFFGPIGIVGGLVIGGLVGGLVSYFRKTSKYADSLRKSKTGVEESFTENEKCIIKDFRKFKIDLNVELKKKLELIYKNIEISDEEWAKIKKEYHLLREKTFARLNEKFGITN